MLPAMRPVARPRVRYTGATCRRDGRATDREFRIVNSMTRRLQFVDLPRQLATLSKIWIIDSLPEGQLQTARRIREDIDTRNLQHGLGSPHSSGPRKPVFRCLCSNSPALLLLTHDHHKRNTTRLSSARGNCDGNGVHYRTRAQTVLGYRRARRIVAGRAVFS